MQYDAILREQKNKFVIGDDAVLTFVIRDSEGVIVQDLTGWTFRAVLSSANGGIEMSGATYFATSGNRITLTIPATDTDTLDYDIKYSLDLQGTLSSKKYTLYREDFWFNKKHFSS